MILSKIAKQGYCDQRSCSSLVFSVSIDSLLQSSNALQEANAWRTPGESCLLPDSLSRWGLSDFRLIMLDHLWLKNTKKREDTETKAYIKINKLGKSIILQMEYGLKENQTFVYDTQNNVILF